MIKLIILALLTLAAFAAAVGTETRDSKPKTCTKYAPAEGIIAARKTLTELKKLGRAPVCTNVYSFTYVRPGLTMSFNSHVKKWKTPKMTNCGLWFWTDKSYELHISCSSIMVKKGDNMVIYNVDSNTVERISDATKTDHQLDGKARNVAIGLEMKSQSRTPSYCCTITSVFKLERKSFFVGGYNGNLASVTNVDVIFKGKLTPLKELPKANNENGVVVHNSKLYSCGGDDIPKKCFTLDLSDEKASWQSSLPLPVPTKAAPMMAVGDNLWVLVKTEIHIIPFKSGTTTTLTLPSGLDVPRYSCGGGDQLNRFVIPSGKSELWINTNSLKPREWTKKASLKKRNESRACMIRGMEIYVTGGYELGGGRNSKAFERIDIDDNYSTHALGDMMESRRTHAMGILDDQIIAIAGYNGNNKIDTIEAYNPTANKWKTLDTKLSAGKLSYIGYVTI